MRWFMFIAAVIFSAFLVSSVIMLDVETNSQHTEIAGLQQQLRQDQAQLAAVSAKASGGHRDLITCGDLQVLTWPVTVNGNDAYGNGLNMSGITEQLNMLPAHCINQ